VNEGLVNLNGDVELASDMGRDLGLPALTHQMFPSTVRALPVVVVSCRLWVIYAAFILQLE